MSQSLTVGAPNPHALRPLSKCENLGQAFQTTEFMDRVRASVPSHMKPDRMLRVFVQAASNTPKLYQANLRSVLGAFLSLSQLGLEPNTPLGHAYLLPFAKRRYDTATRRWVDGDIDVQVILGYKGLLELSYRSGKVTGIHCDLVLPGDEWSFEFGTDAHLRHRPTGKAPDGTEPHHAYMHAQVHGGQVFEVLPWSRVIGIRNQSQGYRAVVAARERAEADGKKVPAAYTEAPWVRHWQPMARKTALRHGSKWLPSSIELAAAVALDEASDSTRLDFGAVLDGVASVMDGGLPEAIDHDPDADTGGAYGLRQGEPGGESGSPTTTVAQGGVQGGQRAAGATAPAKASTPATAKPSGPPPVEFSAWIVDQHGEAVEEHFNPVSFARGYAQLLALSGSRQAMREHNADAIADAIVASQEAATILGEIDYREHGSHLPAEADDPEPVRPVGVVTGTDGKPDFRGYLADLKAAADQLTGPSAEWDAWVAAQLLVIAKLPTVTKKAAERALAERASSWASAQGGAPQAQDAAPAASELERIAATLIKDLSAAASVSAIDALAANLAVTRNLDRLTREAPALAEKVRAHATAKRAELRELFQQQQGGA